MFMYLLFLTYLHTCFIHHRILSFVGN